MTDPPLRIATLRQDHMAALFDGTVRIDGVEASFHSDQARRLMSVPWLVPAGRSSLSSRLSVRRQYS